MAKLKELIFGEGLLGPTLEGDKRFTVRKYRAEAHDFEKGEIVLGKFKDGFDILLEINEDTTVGPFVNLRSPKCNLKQAGYYFDNEYFDELKSYYPDLSWADTGAIVFFQVLHVNGVPAVSINEHGRC
jgi:hypothetical protein